MYEQQRHSIPRNAWKDSLWDICKYGPFHSHFLIGCCCPCISLGHVFTRLNMDLYEQPLPEYTTTTTTTGDTTTPNNICRLSKRDTTTFRLLVALNFMYFSLIMVVILTDYDTIPFHHFHLVYWLSLTILTTRMRFYLRRILNIPTLFHSYMVRNGRRIPTVLESEENSCSCLGGSVEVDGGMVVGLVEDVLVSGCCGPCTVMQMNRHTGLYETYQGHWFNSTGMPKYAPIVVV